MKPINNQKFLKITNASEIHFNYEYKDGLNVLEEPFNTNEKEECVAGGLYFTTHEHINEFVDYGVWIREVQLPIDDPELQVINFKNKSRANKIILGKKSSIFSKSVQELYNINPSFVTYELIFDFNKKFMVREMLNYLSNEDIFTIKDYFLNKIFKIMICNGVERVCNFIICISNYIGENDNEQIARKIISKLIFAIPHHYGIFSLDDDPMVFAQIIGKKFNINVDQVISDCIQISTKKLIDVREQALQLINKPFRWCVNGHGSKICEFIIRITKYLNLDDLKEISEKKIIESIQNSKINLQSIELLMLKFDSKPNFTQEQVDEIIDFMLRDNNKIIELCEGGTNLSKFLMTNYEIIHKIPERIMDSAILQMLKNNKTEQLCDFMNKGAKYSFGIGTTSDFMRNQVGDIYYLKYADEKTILMIENSLSTMKYSGYHKFIVDLMIKKIMFILKNKNKIALDKCNEKLINLRKDIDDEYCIEKINSIIEFCNK